MKKGRKQGVLSGDHEVTGVAGTKDVGTIMILAFRCAFWRVWKRITVQLYSE